MTGTGAPRGRPKKRGKIWNFRRQWKPIIVELRFPKKGNRVFHDNDDDVFRTYWALKALGLPKRFHCEESVKLCLGESIGIETLSAN